VEHSRAQMISAKNLCIEKNERRVLDIMHKQRYVEREQKAASFATLEKVF
jgi:hypothetical protein